MISVSVALWTVVTPAKDDVPKGYEDAAPVQQKASPAKPAPAAALPPVTIAPATPIPAPAKAASPAKDATGKTAKGQPAEKAKAAELPQGYEDAPAAKQKPAAVNALPAMGMPGAAAAGQPQIDANNRRVAQIVQQHREQFRRQLKVEIVFMRRVCQPDPAEKAAFAKAADECMTDVLKECAIAQVRMEHGGPYQQVAPSAMSLLRKRLVEAAKATLRHDHAQQYIRELELREAYRRRTTIDYIIAQTDELLVFSAKQREQLTDALTKSYSDSWERDLQVWMNNTQYMPQILDSQIRPLLTSEQKAVWDGIQKIGGYWGIEIPWAQCIEDE
jgi:hypothetical protein